MWSWPASTTTCTDGVMIGAFPAVLVGSVLFVIAAAIVVWLVARRPDRLTMLVGLAVLALAFFVLPTRVHERYLFPLVAIGAILAAVSIRWRIAYVLSAVATFANMYVVLTTLYPDNPQISDWLGIGQNLASPWGVAIASLIQAAILGWAFFQLREEATEGLAENVLLAGRDRAGSRASRHGFGRRSRRRATVLLTTRMRRLPSHRLQACGRAGPPRRRDRRARRPLQPRSLLPPATRAR